MESGLPLYWFWSYFSNRQQYVEFDSLCSSCQQIRCGVPQRSILGPLLFDIHYWFVQCVMFWNLLFLLIIEMYFSHIAINILCTTFNLEVTKLSGVIGDWANQLCINFKKSNFMILKPRQKKQTFSIDGTPIESPKETFFLGVVIDENLKWKPHILIVSRKCSKSIGILYRSTFCLSTASLCTLY